jgi:hypothetical protein
VTVLKKARENDDGGLFTRYATSSLDGMLALFQGPGTLVLALCSFERLDLKDFTSLLEDQA